MFREPLISTFVFLNNINELVNIAELGSRQFMLIQGTNCLINVLDVSLLVVVVVVLLLIYSVHYCLRRVAAWFTRVKFPATSVHYGQMFL